MGRGHGVVKLARDAEAQDCGPGAATLVDAMQVRKQLVAGNW